MTTRTDTTDTRPGQPPRQRRNGPTEPKGYAKARTGFEQRAQDWLLARPARIMCLPEDLHLVAALGVPGTRCGALIYRDRDAGHTIVWDPGAAGRHWAAAITAVCGPACR